MGKKRGTAFVLYNLSKKVLSGLPHPLHDPVQALVKPGTESYVHVQARRQDTQWRCANIPWGTTHVTLHQ